MTGYPDPLNLVSNTKNIIIDCNNKGFVNISKIFLRDIKKKFNNWYLNKKTVEYLEALARHLGVSTNELFLNAPQKGGKKDTRDIFVHPAVAMDVLQYISCDFRILVNT